MDREVIPVSDQDGSGRMRASWLGCLSDGRDHVVTHAELSGATGRRGGLYRALCGHVVMPGSMLEPPSPACVACVRFVRVHPSVVTPERASEVRQRRRPGPIAGYLARLMAPVGTGMTPTSPVPTGLHPERGQK